MKIDWDSGDGLKSDEEIDAAIAEIAAMVNKHNDSANFEATEQIARDALATALYNLKLLRDVLAQLDRQRDS